MVWLQGRIALNAAVARRPSTVIKHKKERKTNHEQLTISLQKPKGRS
jgi:hypothetical protein